MFWSKLCKSNWNCAWNFAFPVFYISPIVWNMCKNLHYESVYFKELNNEQEYYWPTIYRAGTAVVSTVITTCYSFLLRWNSRLFLVCFQMRVRKNWTEVFFHFLYPSLLLFHLSSAFARLYVSTLRSTNDLISHQEEEKLITNFCASRKQLIIKKYSSEIGLISTPW